MEEQQLFDAVRKRLEDRLDPSVSRHNELVISFEADPREGRAIEVERMKHLLKARIDGASETLSILANELGIDYQPKQYSIYEYNPRK